MNLLVLLNVGGAVVDCTAVRMGAMEEPLTSCEKGHVIKVRKRAELRAGCRPTDHSATPAVPYGVNAGRCLDLRLMISQ